MQLLITRIKATMFIVYSCLKKRHKFSLVTQTTISALLLGLRYRHVVTLKRTRLIAIGGWIVSVVAASTSFLNLFIVS